MDEKVGDEVVLVDDLKMRWNKNDQPLHDLMESLDLVGKEKKMEEYQKRIEEPDFWNRQELSQQIMKELRSLENSIMEASELMAKHEDIGVMIEMCLEEDEESMLEEANDMLDEFDKTYEEMRIQTLLSGEYDSENAILTLHPGEGGTESCDWANMLYRMYKRYAEKNGVKVEV